MKHNTLIFLVSLFFFFACKKENTENNFPDSYPAVYISSEEHIITPYVKMYTSNGEIKNENIIHDYLQRREITTNFSYQEITHLKTAAIYLTNADSVLMRFPDDRDLIITSRYKSVSYGKQRYFTSNLINSSYVYSSDLVRFKLRNEMSLYKWGYEVFPTFSDDFEIKTFTYKPEIYAYKADSNILVIPYLNYTFIGNGGKFRLMFPNKFNFDVVKSLSSGDTLLVQESELFLKRQ